MYRRDADQQSDSMVLLWDAIASGRQSPAPAEHAATFDLISDFLALDDTPMPDPGFLNRLEAQVISAGTSQRVPAGFSLNPLNALRPYLPAPVRKRFQQESPSRRRLADYGRWAVTQAAMALLLLITLGGVGVVYMTGTLHDSEPTLPSTGGGEIISAPVTGGESQDLPMTGGPGNNPGLVGGEPAAAVQPESIVSLEIDPASLGAAPANTWNVLEFAEVHVQPGEGFSTDAPYFAAIPGIAVFHVVEGNLHLTVDGPTDVYRMGSGVPERIPAGTPMNLAQDDTAVFAIESIATVENSEDTELVMLAGYASNLTEMSGSNTVPAGYVDPFWAVGRNIEPLAPGPVTISYERWPLPPGGLTHIEVREGDRGLGWNNQAGNALRMLPGTYDELPEAAGVITPRLMLEDLGPGDYTFFNPHDVPLAFYLMRVDQAGNSTTPAMAQPESLLSAVIDPTSVGAESQTAWQTAALATVTLSPGMQFAPQDSNWGDALDAFVLLEGAVTVESATPSQIVRASSEQPEPLAAGVAAELAPGDSWLAGIGESFSMISNGSGDATLMLFHHGVDQSLFGFGAGTIGLYPPGFRPSLHAENPTPLTFDGPVSLSLERVTVNTGETFWLDVTGDELLLLANTDGRAMRATQDGSSTPLTLLGGAALNLYSPGAYIISHLYGDAPLTLYIARMSDAPAVASNAAATPAAESASPVAQQAVTEVLVQFLADPASSPIGNPEAWDEVVAEIGQLEPGASVDVSLRNLTCCRFGLGALHIIDGTTSVELSGPSSVIRAGQDPATPELYEPSTDIALGPGDTIWYGIEARPFVTNTGSTDLTLLNFSVHDFAGDASVEGRLDTYRRPGYAMKSNIYTSDELPLQPGIASTSIHRIDLDSDASSTLTVAENQRLIALIAQGTIQFHKDTGGKPVPPSLITSRGVGLGTAFHNFTPGDYIIENNKDDPATLYVLTITTVPD